MSQATELTNQVIDYIYRQGGFSWRASSTGIFDQAKQSFRTAPKKGVSDILAVYKGRLIAVEVKIGKDKLSPEQVGFMANVVHAGGIAFVATSFEQFKEQWIVATSIL